MAKIEVSGSIRRVFYDGKGATLAEPYKSQDGTTKSREFTLWFTAPHGLDIGDQITAVGVLSASIEDWQNQDGTPKLDNSGKPGRSIRLSINGAQIAHRETEPVGPVHWPADEMPF